MGTYGITSILGSTFGLSGGFIYTYHNGSNPLGATNLQSMYVYVEATFEASEFLRLAIYDDSAFKPNNLLGQTDTVEGTGVAGWVGLNLQSPVAISGTNRYWLAVHASAGFQVRRSLATINDYTSKAAAFASGPPNPFAAGTTISAELSLYADEAAIGGGGGGGAAQAGALIILN